MLEARWLEEDTRLRPGERRIERFETTVPRRGQLRADMTLRYQYEPEIFTRETMSIQIASASTG